MRFLIAFCVASFVCATMPASAQDSVLSPPEISDSGQDYLDVIRYRGIDAEVVYFDPTKPAPPLDTQFKPEREQQATTEYSADTRLTMSIIAVVLLISVAAFVYFSAGRTSVSFRSANENARRSDRHDRSDLRVREGSQPDLEAILKQTDRDQAVIGLAQLALARCLSANEVLFKRSWTHREALRSLPQSLWYIPDLRALVLESERVHFGRRSITEPEFNQLLNRIRPVLNEVPA